MHAYRTTVIRIAIITQKVWREMPCIELMGDVHILKSYISSIKADG